MQLTKHQGFDHLKQNNFQGLRALQMTNLSWKEKKIKSQPCRIITREKIYVLPQALVVVAWKQKRSLIKYGMKNSFANGINIRFN